MPIGVLMAFVLDESTDEELLHAVKVRLAKTASDKGSTQK